MNTVSSSVTPLRACVLACAVFLLNAAGSFAQTPKSSAKAPAVSAPATATGALFSVTETTLKPDKVQEYERLLKEEVNPALKKAGYTDRSVYTRGTFGPGHTYITASPIEKYAQYDEPGRLSKAIGEEATRALLAKIAACQVSSRTFAVRQMLDISHDTKAEMNVAVIMVRELAPGKKAEWRKFMKEEYLPAVKSSESLGYHAYETMYGGSTNEVTTISFLKNYAELDGPNAVSRKIGAEAYQKLFAKMPPGLTVRTDRWILRFRKELSLVSAAK